MCCCKWAGDWRIIDYKTSDAGGDLAGHAQRYRLQLGVYAAAARQKLALAVSPRLFLHYLRHNQTIELAASDCETELQSLEYMLHEVVGGHG